MAELSARSLKRLEGAHPDLRRLLIEAAKDCEVHFEIGEVLRTLARQKQLKAVGASKTMNSRHLTGHAVDIVCYVGGQVRWDWPLYRNAAAHIKQVAARLGIPLEWGGDWRSFPDGPHFQLPWKAYP